MELVIDANGALWMLEPPSRTLIAITLPTGMTAKVPFCRPSRCDYQGATYAVGQFDAMLQWTPFETMVKAGIKAPAAAPTLAASGVGITGSAIVRYTFAHIEGGIAGVGGVVVGESNPSPPSTTLALVNQGRATSGMAASSVDTRVNYIRVWVDMDGAGVSHLAGVVPIGTTTLTENISTATLETAETLPTKTGTDNATTDDTGAYGLPPYAVAMVIWHDRGILIDPTRPGVLYSALFKPWAYNDDDALSYIATRDGEQPLGVIALEDELLVLCTGRAVYSMSGWTGGDFRLRKVSHDVQALGHHGNANCGGLVVIPADQGPVGYRGGAFRNLMSRSWRESWVAAYAANEAEYEDAIGAYDANSGNYLLLVTLPTAPQTLFYVGFMRPILEEGALDPYWSRDIQNRKTYTIGQLLDPASRHSSLVFGGCDGYLRQEDPDDADDDGDSYGKKLTIKHKHFILVDQGGDDAHGREITDLDIFLKTEAQAAVVNGYAGDPDAANATSPQYTETIPASALTDGNGAHTAKGSHHLTDTGLTGKGVTVEIVITAPLGVEYNGLHLHHKEGEQSRP